MRRWLAALLCLGLLCTWAGAVEGTPSNWAQEEVDAALEAGLVPSLTSTPAYQDTLTREQFAQLVVQTVEVLLGQELAAAPADTFADCTSLAVRKASAAGIIGGIGGGKFAPEQATNREQIATMMARAIDYLEETSGLNLAPQAGSLAGFTDTSQVSGWAAEAMGRMAANGLMEGSGSALSPQNPCTVEQGILLLVRLHRLAQETGREPEPQVPPVPQNVDHYAAYPTVPDFGDMIDYTGEVGTGEMPDYNAVFYEYTSVDGATDTAYLQYAALLEQEGYLPVYMYGNSGSVYFFNPEQPDLVVAYELFMEDAVWISLITVTPPAGSAPCYSDHHADVPDLGAALGIEPSLCQTGENNAWTIYGYELPQYADHIILAPWFTRMPQAGYVLLGLTDSKEGYIPLWENERTGCRVTVFEYYSYLIVELIPGDS
ncbi:S-layer homology domain-containing protein [uncultured Flavonifractor sp.]|uniref:S-layer homology domain-containing protein n=1 Tax=uncultured Flavonifractor sp. TaxID=1193534 RepID=UPI00262FC664|nr:S-layer homology domain-containing protein [uncultured Flavonifractor sp.]